MTIKYYTRPLLRHEALYLLSPKLISMLLIFVIACQVNLEKRCDSD